MLKPVRVVALASLGSFSVYHGSRYFYRTQRATTAVVAPSLVVCGTQQAAFRCGPTNFILHRFVVALGLHAQGVAPTSDMDLGTDPLVGIEDGTVETTAVGQRQQRMGSHRTERYDWMQSEKFMPTPHHHYEEEGDESPGEDFEVAQPTERQQIARHLTGHCTTQNAPC